MTNPLIRALYAGADSLEIVPKVLERLMEARRQLTMGARGRDVLPELERLCEDLYVARNKVAEKGGTEFALAERLRKHAAVFEKALEDTKGEPAQISFYVTSDITSWKHILGL